jgi:hypothetical protein
VNGPRSTNKSLTKKELLDIYQDPNLKILDLAKARGSARVYNQLWRNMIFAEWMASLDGAQTQAHLVSLTRHGYEHQSCVEFAELIRPGLAGRFVHRTWEEIDDRWAARLPELARLHHYLVTKTAGLVPAFRFEELGDRHVVRRARDELSRPCLFKPYGKCATSHFDD